MRISGYVVGIVSFNLGFLLPTNMSQFIRLIVSFNRNDEIRIVSMENSTSYAKFKTSICNTLNLNGNEFSTEYFDIAQSKYVTLSEENVHLVKKNGRVLIVHDNHTDNSHMPLIEGRLFPDINDLYVNSHKIKIAEIENANLGTGLMTWNSSVYFEQVCS